MAASDFDVDGTLIRTNLVHPTLFYLANMKSPLESLGKLSRAAFKAPQMLLAERRDRRLFNEVLFSAYEGVSRDRIRVLAEEAFEKVVKPALFTFAEDLIARFRRVSGPKSFAWRSASGRNAIFCEVGCNLRRSRNGPTTVACLCVVRDELGLVSKTEA